MPTESAEPTLLVAGHIDYRKLGALPDRREDQTLLTWLDTRGGYRERWLRLPWTHLEATGVAGLHAEAFGEDAERLVLLRDEATEERIKLDAALDLALQQVERGERGRPIDEVLREI